MEPIVSILIPTRNRPEFLVQAVKSALAQTYCKIEVIVTDNSDTDLSGDMLANISDDRVRYTRNSENIGPILNWKKALELAKGEYCLILPDDDYLVNPFFIEDAVKILSDSRIQLVIPDCILSYSNKNSIGISGYSGRIDGKEFIRKGFHIPHIGNVFRKALAQQLGAFHSNDILWSDIELWMRLMSLGDAHCYNKPSILYRFHDDNIVLNMSRAGLIVNSRFIRSAVESFANEDLIATLVVRYLCTVDSISNKVDNDFICAVVQRNQVRKHVIGIMLMVKYQRIKRNAKAAIIRLIRSVKLF